MRIALVTETYLPQTNGVSRTLDRLVDFLAGEGDQILLLLPRYPRPGPPLPPGVDRRDFPALPLPFYPEVVLPFAAPATLRRDFDRFRPGLVHIATEGPLGWAALRAARQLGIPVVSSYHSNFSSYLRLYGFGWLEGACWSYLRGFHNATRMTFCPTPSIRELLLTRGFRNVRTWGRGVDSGRFHPGKRNAELRRQWGVGPASPALLYAGRLAVEKNLEMLVEAFRHLRCPEARLVLVGDGPLRPKLEQAGDPRLVFVGYRQGEELAAIYASADLFVFPSLTDTFGNVLLEGMASGLPAIGFRVPGPQDVVRDGGTGVLVERIDAGDLAQGIAGMLADPERRLTMGRQARTFAETLSWPAILERLRQDYQEVLLHPGTSAVGSS